MNTPNAASNDKELKANRAGHDLADCKPTSDCPVCCKHPQVSCEVCGHGMTESDKPASDEPICANCERLWSLLDDIDTLDDACKDHDAIFRKRVYAVQQKRHEIYKSDGYTLSKPTSDEPKCCENARLGYEHARTCWNHPDNKPDAGLVRVDGATVEVGGLAYGCLSADDANKLAAAINAAIEAARQRGLTHGRHEMYDHEERRKAFDEVLKEVVARCSCVPLEARICDMCDLAYRLKQLRVGVTPKDRTVE